MTTRAKRSWFVVGLMLATGLTALAGDPAGTDLYPVAVGDEWTYRTELGGLGESRETRTVRTVLGTRKIAVDGADMEALEIREVDDGNEKSRRLEYAVVGEKEVRVYVADRSGAWVRRATFPREAPAGPKATLGWTEGDVEFEVKPDEATVPFGKVSGHRFHGVVRAATGKWTEFVLAPGVGLAWEKTVDPGCDAIPCGPTELVSFRRAPAGK